MLKLYNSLTCKKEEFTPIDSKKIRLYVCGITPYDTTHVGHAFVYAQFDALVRFLKFSGYEINYTQNITDIDDDTIKRAKETGTTWEKLGEFWTQKYVNDLKSLNIEMPTHFVKATDSIPTMIKIVSKLVADGHAYEKGGNVYFDVSTFKNYGHLSKLNEQEMIDLSKERGADPNDPNKRNPLDFILWQKSKVDEPFWPSPFGDGRPGWHIECSAMNYDYLGAQIDIHGGGYDLIFPHHESEIAQSESFTRKVPFSKFWMHVAMVYYQTEKMSKSLGNLIMVEKLLKTYSANAIRYLLLSHHYRKPWEFENNQMQLAQKSIELLEKSVDKDLKPESEVIQALSDDLNIPKALFYLLKEAKSGKKISQKTLELLGFTL